MGARRDDQIDIRAFNEAFDVWSSGNQGECERMLDKDNQQFPADQNLAFFKALCTRSRWEREEAMPLLQAVVDLDPTSLDGRASQDLIAIDVKDNADASYVRLKRLSDGQPRDVLLLWSLAIASRQLEYDESDRVAERGAAGIACYQRILKLIKGKGPVMIHQTYANLLDDSGAPDAALPQRLIAVSEEARPWSLKGLASTYDELGRTADAARVRARLAEDFPSGQ